ncbi:phosphatidylinositide phosphatase SAC1like protein putative [Fimicolochytrium jonesii]|uniref:phosphatidylinositide phosphatase SAC1like protein putative n=1 Tax=Fimicolochytrium jonesii TaxID=1396493 RepID=UPI0022FED22C|nr:phosphatidylinositide phosphatase SAC1like protein putative [Fimicolochytrium jonesii]KAI8825853.1 phosphatidylinositide phosphatase SAC1like protein putative [Fimicolochytrium jonesii]
MAQPTLINPSTATKAIAVQKHMLSRLLYPNPVCLLTVSARVPLEATTTETTGEAGDGLGTWARNVMTISWLTAIDNQGHFVSSMNLNRHTWSLLQHTNTFVLNVPTLRSEELVLSIGSCSGKVKDKFEEFAIPICKINYTKLEWEPTEDEDPPLIAIQGTVAHLLCEIEDISERDGHAILFCRITEAYAQESVWDGRNFGSKDDPLLSFLGTKRFATMIPP